MEAVEVAGVSRFSMWVELTGSGEELRGEFGRKGEAVENARKYWLTRTGLFRVFVRDREAQDTIVFDRRYGD